MGIISAGILSPVTNKVGNVVGRIRLGKNVLTGYQPNVSNPNTEAQQEVRQRFGLLAAVSGRIGGLINMSFRSFRGNGRTAYNIFMSRNYATAITGEWPSFSIDYTKLQISDGKVAGAYAPSVAVVEGTINFGWTDNSTEPNAAANDMMGFAIHNGAKDVWIYVTNAATRNATTFALPAPAAWSGDSVDVYIYFSDSTQSEFSPSINLGTVIL